MYREQNQLKRGKVTHPSSYLPYQPIHLHQNNLKRHTTITLMKIDKQLSPWSILLHGMSRTNVPHFIVRYPTLRVPHFLPSRRMTWTEYEGWGDICMNWNGCHRNGVEWRYIRLASVLTCYWEELEQNKETHLEISKTNLVLKKNIPFESVSWQVKYFNLFYSFLCGKTDAECKRR